MLNKCNLWWLDLHPGPRVLEATALPQPLLWWIDIGKFQDLPQDIDSENFIILLNVTQWESFIYLWNGKCVQVKYSFCQNIIIPHIFEDLNVSKQSTYKQ